MYYRSKRCQTLILLNNKEYILHFEDLTVINWKLRHINLKFTIKINTYVQMYFFVKEKYEMYSLYKNYIRVPAQYL